jgi:phosphoribosylanthranilate isomerase
MMKVKICGITRMEDALDAAEAGADALGFIFVRESPRYVNPETAGEIIRQLPPFIAPVGVFVNANREEILDTIHRSGIRCLQFHGEETPEEIEGFSLPVCKAFRVSRKFRIEELTPYRASAYLLDAFIDGIHGGTGKEFDWQIAVEAKKHGRIVLSGGLTPLNIERAVTMVAPYAIDVNSGVESAPGIKDKRKLLALFQHIGDARK